MFDDTSYLEKFSLKYSENVPKDYDISEIQFTYDFVFPVLKQDAAIDEAIDGVVKEYKLSEDYLREYFIENKYILNKAKMKDISAQLNEYNTKTLKKILKSHGIKASGKREKIEKRIIDNKLIGNEYYLSSKSKVFYKNKKRRIRIFNQYLSNHYYFNEFNEFYMDNYRKKEVNIPIEFINIHIRKAMDEKNHESYVLNNQVMAEHFFKKENNRKMLVHVLKNYCMNINPIWKINDLEDHNGVLLETYENLVFLHDNFSKNTIINTFYFIWDSFDFEKIIVTKYDAYRILKDILNLKNLDKINSDLNKRFYENEDLKIKHITQKTLFDF